MTIKEIYDIAISKGIDADFRSNETIKNSQDRLRTKYEKMSDEEKEEFDVERLDNPFSDSRILFGAPDTKVKKILVGIDIDGDELFLAKELGGIDLVISHHPRGKALAGLDDVMQLQVDLLNLHGVPVNIAEKLLKKRMTEVSRGIAPSNHNRVIDIARHLSIPLICIHTPCDNMAARFVDDKLKASKPVFVEDVINSLREVPEYREAISFGAGPKIFLGGTDNRVGNIMIDMTGGTEGSSEVYEKLAQAGIGTVVGMHISEKSYSEAEKAHINVIIAGHISSDSIGMNLFLDWLEESGVEVLACSGLIRVSRLGK